MSKSSTLKMGIVGAGTWGETHAGIYNEHPFAETVAICDVNKAKAEAMAAKYGIPEVYSDYKEMAAKSSCDAVAIVTPDYLHADIAITMAGAKKDLLIEKPIATTREDTFNMMEAFERNNIRAMVDLHNRWNPPFNEAKRQIDTGELGAPYSGYFRLNDIKWVATDLLPWAANSSILWFLGSHSLDTLRWLLDSDVERVYSVSRYGLLKEMGIDVPDMYLTTLEFKNGCIAQMENGWVTPNANPNINDMKCNILCTQGMVNIDTTSHGMISVVTEQKNTVPDVLVRNAVDGRVKGFAYESIRAFVDRMHDGKPFLVSLEDAANTTLTLLAVLESAETGVPVKVKY